VQVLSANTEWIVDALLRTCSESIKRNGEALNSDSSHFHAYLRLTRIATEIGPLCSAITRSRRRGHQQIFMMQATQYRFDVRPEALVDPMAGYWYHKRHDPGGGSGTPGPGTVTSNELAQLL